MHCLLLIAGWLLLAGLATPCPASAAEPLPLSAFIEQVRGHDVTTIRRSFPPYNEGLFGLLYGAGPGIIADAPAVDLFGDQRVVTPGGAVIDVGHVIAALESAAAPTPLARLVERQTGCDMPAAVTWAGDVGKALHDFVAAGGAGDSDAAYDRELPPEDLLGDIDGWLLAQTVTAGDLDVAALLESTYLAGGEFERGRFRRFARSVDGGLAERQIVCFARALALLGGTGVRPEAITAAALPFVDRFLRAVADGQAQEVP